MSLTVRTSTSEGPQDIPAVSARGQFAAHHINPHRIWGVLPGQFAVTHVPTGCLVDMGLTRAAAVALVEHLAQALPDFGVDCAFGTEPPLADRLRLKAEIERATGRPPDGRGFTLATEPA